MDDISYLIIHKHFKDHLNKVRTKGTNWLSQQQCKQTVANMFIFGNAWYVCKNNIFLQFWSHFFTVRLGLRGCGITNSDLSDL